MHGRTYPPADASPFVYVSIIVIIRASMTFFDMDSHLRQSYVMDEAFALDGEFEKISSAAAGGVESTWTKGAVLIA